MTMRIRLAALVGAGALMLGSGMLAASGTAVAGEEPSPWVPPWAQLCAGLVPTIYAVPGVVTVGTNLPDVILGTPAADEIHARQGDDVVCGLGGNDLIFGGAGDDLLLGQRDDDNVFGGEGDDDMFGGEGNDSVFGGEGDDDLFGGDGVDLLDGGNQVVVDRADGGPLNDTCVNDEVVVNC
jgi:Ca2+-binding RTX toxin-like protein